MSEDAPLETLQDLSESITSLQETLEPLLAVPLQETLAQLDSVQNAKLDVSLAFTIHNLIWMYLKCKGINTKDHPVTRELERLKKYFGKIKDAESNAKRTLQVDKAAAGRFIRAALSAAAAAQEEEEGNAPQPETSQVGTHTRFRWVAPDASKLVRDGDEDMQDGGEDDDDDDESEVDFAAERTMKLDKDAAGRFIRAAIRSAERSADKADSSRRPLASHQAPSTATNGDKEEGELGSEEEVIDEVVVDELMQQPSLQAPKRRGMDPFAGYDDQTSGGSPKKTRKRGKKKGNSTAQ